jgi:CRISPR-associated protein Cmr3
MRNEIWDFTLLDTGFFRSGQPFHAGEGGHSRINSCFPPPMNTLQGAIRSTLAAANGWRPGLNWPEELGDSDCLGSLSLKGPFLITEGKPLFPAPLNLLIKELPGTNSEGKPVIDTAFLVPGEKYSCDLGSEVSLPQKKGKLDGARPPKNLYVTTNGYHAIAKMEKPHKNDLYFHDRLWEVEPRIGLKLNAETRTAKEHNLYRISHIRPKRGLKVRVIVEGLAADWPKPKHQIVPLGGEGRLAAIEITPTTDNNFKDMFPSIPELTTHNEKIHFTITLITPAYGNKEKLEKLVSKGPAAPGHCTSASIGKPLFYGGWDLKNQEPRPLRPFLPPGSTWFFEADQSERKNIERLHGSQIDKEKSAYGYGQILIGIWEVD